MFVCDVFPKFEFSSRDRILSKGTFPQKGLKIGQPGKCLRSFGTKYFTPLISLSTCRHLLTWVYCIQNT